MDILLLSTAAQHTTRNTDVILDPKRLKKWIDDLPEIDIISTVAQLQTAIQNFNELGMDDKQRLKLLQTYYETLQNMLIAYDEIRISMLQVSAQERNRLREDVMWLFLSLANGYKLIINNAFERKVSPKRDPDLCHAIYAAMELILDGLLYAYRSHLSPPPLARLEINQLYYYAVLSNVADTMIKSAKGHMQQPSISTLYKQHILMSLSDPYHMNATDILELFMFLELIANECSIELGGSTEPPEGKYHVGMFSDDSPVPCIRLTEDNAVDKQTAVIDVWPIVNTLAAKAAMHDMEHQSFAELQERHMIDLVIRKLGHFGERKMPRREIEKPVKLCMGMQNVHTILKKMVSQPNVPIQQTDTEFSDWNISNENESGYLLISTSPGLQLDKAVGEVICITHKLSVISSKYIELGIIRWIRREQDNNFRIGVERLPGTPLPIFYKMESEYGLDMEEDLRHTGIYIPKSEKAETDSIIVMKEIFNKDRNIDLYFQDKKFTTSMAALLHDSPLYIQLKIKR